MLDQFFEGWNIPMLLSMVIFTIIGYKGYQKTKSRPMMTCLPGIYTSLGLLGTFVSICGSLNDLPEKFEIKDIIAGLIPAFTTSIWGLFGAMVVTIWTKYKFAKEEANENHQLHNRTPEEYIQDIAFNTRILIDRQKVQEEKFNEYSEKLNESIANQSEILKEFINNFVNRMDDIFNQMRGAIQQQVKDFGNEQFTQTKEVITNINQELSDTSKQLIESQQESVKNMMNDTNTKISDITTTVASSLSKLTNEMSTVLNNLSTQQDTRLNTIVTNYDAFAAKMNDQLKAGYEEVTQHNVDSLQQMVDLRDAYQETSKEMVKAATDMNEKTTANLRDAMAGFVSDLQTTVSSQCTTLSDAIKQNVESLDKSYQFIKSLMAEIRQNYDQSVIAYGDAVSVAHRTNESSEKMIKETNKSLGAVEETNKKIDEVMQVLTDRKENLEQLTKQINSIGATIEQLQKLESTLNKIANHG